MDAMRQDLPRVQEPRGGPTTKSVVFKFFKTMPTTATIRTVLARMGCQRIIPEALRTKRVGVDFIAVVRLKNTEDAQEIVRNKTMLRDGFICRAR